MEYQSDEPAETLFDFLARQQEIPAPLPAIPPAGKMRFNGPEYAPEHDQARLSGQILRIFEFMRDGAFRTLPEIANATRSPAASVSAQLRHLRKPRFGGHTVNKRHRGERSAGLWEYQLVVADQLVSAPS